MTSRLSRRQLLAGAAAAFLPAAACAPSRAAAKTKSTVALVSGSSRYRNVLDALRSIDDKIRPALLAKKSVLIKPNVVVATNASACTHADALRAVLEYIAQSGFRGPAVIAESGWCYTIEGFGNYGYAAVVNEYKKSSAFTSLKLIDLNEEGLYVLQPAIDSNLQIQSVRAAKRLFDPDAFIVSTALPKTHNYVVATMSVKNMAMGAPLHATRAEGWQKWNDKMRMHDNYRVANLNICNMAQELSRYWGLAVIDGYQGMQGNGPASGTTVASHVAIASTDFLASDRVAAECMGIDSGRMGYLNYASRLGLGQYDLSNINVVGVSPAAVQRKYQLHADTSLEMEWQKPFRNCR
jgi:uncharacterized protein (DUF362 family)